MNNLERLKKQHQKLGEEYKKLGEEIEKLENSQSEIKLYDLVKFSNLEWYIIAEDEISYTLFLKDKLSPEQCAKHFDERFLDSDKDVRFNPNCKNIWWSDSPIRMTLNSEFLKDLDKSKMELMTTNVGIDGQSRTTEDYVRFITKEEAEKLPVEILESNYEYGYWTMSPSNFHGNSSAYEFIVASTGELCGWSVVSVGYGVRPVIRVTKNNAVTKIENKNN